MEADPRGHTPRLDRVMARSDEIAAEFGHDYIGVEHVFLAIIRDKHSVPTQVLSHVTDVGALDFRLSETIRAYRDHDDA